jgi:hypothetical protein
MQATAAILPVPHHHRHRNQKNQGTFTRQALCSKRVKKKFKARGLSDDK